MMGWDHILFDLDGTLTDSAPGILNGVRYALDALGVPIGDERGLYRFIGPPLWDSFMDFYGFSKERAEQAVVKYREYYNETGILENAVYDGIPGLLDSLRGRGKALYVATSKPLPSARRVLDHFGLSPYFTFVAGSEPDGARSDKSEVIRYAMEQNAIPPDRAVMVGDRKHDIIGARKAGVASVGVLYGYGGRAELEGAGAGAIAEDMAQLLALLGKAGTKP